MLKSPELELYDGKYVPAMDGLRGLAILLVVVFHCFEFLRITSLGWVGVDLFFVLSGFLITGILLRSRCEKHYLKNFFVRRVLRIFPLYYATLIVFFVVIPQLFPELLNAQDELYKNQGWYWLYGQNFLYVKLDGFLWSDRDNVLNHFWSLSVEEHFYLVWPFVILFFSRRKFLTISFFLIFLSVALRIYLLGTELSWVFPYVFTVTRLDALLMGALTAYAFYDEKALKLFKKAVPYLLYISILLLGLFLIVTRQVSVFHVLANSRGLFLLVLAIFFSSMLTYTLSKNRNNRLKKIFEMRFFKFFGKYSYSLYVFHMPVYLYLIRYVFDPLHHVIRIKFVSDFTIGAIAVAISIILSLASYYLLEKRFLLLKRYFT